MNHFKTLALCLVFTVTACSESTPATPEFNFAIGNANPEQAKSDIKPIMYKLVEVCRGLATHSADIGKITINTSILRGFENGLLLTFKVADKPVSLPPSLKRSAGNTCHIDINKRMTQAFIAKRACHSICTGEWSENDPESLGKTFTLSHDVAERIDSQPLAEVLDTETVIKGLSLINRRFDESDNGSQRQRWDIKGTEYTSEFTQDGEKPKTTWLTFEIIGNNSADADLAAWQCVQYNDEGNRENPTEAVSLCRKLWLSALANVITHSDKVGLQLLHQAVTDKTTAIQKIGNLSIETDGQYYFIRAR